MPNIVGITELNGPVNLLVVLLGDGRTVTVTRAEAQAYIDAHPGFTDAQIEAQFVSVATGRWVGITDTIAMHLRTRSPVAIQLWIGAPGVAVPPQWWLN